MENILPLTWRTTTKQSKFVPGTSLFGIFSSCAGELLPRTFFSRVAFFFCSSVLFSRSAQPCWLNYSAVLKTGFGDNDMKRLMHLLITSTFSLAAAVSPLNEAVVNLPWLKFPTVRMETYQVSLSPRNPKTNHALPVKPQFGLTSFFEYKLTGSAGISCSQESLHFCL